MLRKLSFTALGFVAAQFGSLDAYAQRAVTPQGGTPPISRTETRPNVGAGAYRSSQDRSVRSATSTDAGVRSTATGSRIGTRAGSRASFGATFDDGVINDLIVDQVTAGSPAALAGLQAGDTIISINDRRFRDQRQASTFLRGFTGDSLNLTLLRNGAMVDVTANTAVNRNAINANSVDRAPANANTNSTAQHDFGINDAIGFGMRLGATDDGIVVREVARNSLAADTGIRVGDRLVSLGGQNVSDSAAVNQVLSGIGRDPTLDVVVARDGQPVDLSANLARYTGYYSTVDHSRGGTVDTTSATRQFGNANLEGFQSTLGATFSRDTNGNMVVSRISPNSYAAQLGLQRGDVMFGSNGQPITTSQGLMQFFSGARPGSEFGLDVWRNGQQTELTGTLDQAFFNELSAASTIDGQIEEKSNTGSTARSGTNQQPNRTAMRNGSTAQPGTSRFDDSTRNDPFDSQGNGIRPDAFRDSRVNDNQFIGDRQNGSANANTSQFQRSPSGNPYRRPGSLGNAGNDQQENGSNRERRLNQRPLNQGQSDRRNNQGSAFNDDQSNANGQSTRIDTPEARGQLNAVDELRESFQRGQSAGQGQNPGIAGQQQRPGSLGNRPRTGGNLGTGINPQGRGAGTGQGTQVQGGAQGNVQGGATTGGNRGGAGGGATRGGGAAGGASGGGAASGGRR